MPVEIQKFAAEGLRRDAAQVLTDNDASEFGNLIPEAGGLSTGDLSADDFISKAGGFLLEEKLDGIEKQYLVKALELSEGNQSKAAAILGISRFALKRKMEKFSMTP